MNWHEYFLDMAGFVSSKSKDPSTKCGAVIVSPNNVVLATGYNGFPRGVREEFSQMRINPQYVVGDPSMRHGEPMHIVETKLDPKRWSRPEKYNWVEHAERNAIYAAAREGVRLDGATMYITAEDAKTGAMRRSFPCNDCARAIIQVGIKTVVWPEGGSEWDANSAYVDMQCLTEQMFSEAGVKIVKHAVI